jgi:hypothetical protein
MKLEFPRQILEKYLNVEFHENPSNENRVVPCGQTDGQMGGRIDRHDETNGPFPQICQSAP